MPRSPERPSTRETIRRLAAAVVVAAATAMAACGQVRSPGVISERFDLPSGAPVAIDVLLQEDHVGQAERYLSAARTTITAYADRFRITPFTSLTIVDPGWSHRPAAATVPAGHATTVVADTRLLSPRLAMEPEMAVTRAVGARLWQKALSCGDDAGWFIEGLNKYASTSAVASQFGVQQTPPAFAYAETRYFGGFIPLVLRIPLRNATAGNGLDDYRRHPTVDLRRPPAGARDRRSAAAKTALAMGTLERWIGAPTWDAVLEEFASRRWAHCPAPADLERVAQEVTGLDLSWFFSQVFDSVETFDYGVESLTSTSGAAGGQVYRTTVTVRRYGGAEFTGTSAPRVGAFESGRGMQLRLVFDDGSERVDSWDGRDQSRLFTYESSSPVRSATIDPGDVLLLDTNRTNNSRMRVPAGPEAATKWAARWALWLQDLLLTYASLV
jgi:hypothetical protein